jgi:AbrB family looped-hinge helix DNA binding protein
MKHKATFPEIMGLTAIGERGQLVIPKEVRDALDLKAGSKLMVLMHEGKMILVPAEEMRDFMKMMSKKIASVSKLLEDQS